MYFDTKSVEMEINILFGVLNEEKYKPSIIIFIQMHFFYFLATIIQLWNVYVGLQILLTKKKVETFVAKYHIM